MSQTFKLFRLQQLDSQLDRIHARLKEIDVALSQDETLRSAQEHYQQTTATLEDHRKQLRHAEREINDQRLKIEQSESTLYSGKVRNPKELQDLQNEVAALKRYYSVLEDRQLEAMIAVEEAEGEQQKAHTELETAQAEFEKKNSHLSEEKGSLEKEAARLVSERQAAAGSIPGEEMALYDQLRSTRRGIAVAKVSDRSCSACGSMLSAALLHVARSPSQMARCTNCGRILYGG